MHKILICSLILATTFFGCAKHESEKHELPSVLKNEQIVRVNLHGSPSSIHPHTGIDLNCRILIKALFEGLTRINNQGIIELAAAESVSVSPEQTTYTFTLRPHKWSNGEPVTAYQFENTWKKALAPDSSCLRADLFYPIKNAQRAKKGEVPLEEVGVYALDPQTLVVELEHPTPYFLDMILNPLFAPLYEDAPSPQIFNGPFQIKKWDHDSALVLEKNPLYWDAASVLLDEIHFSFISDPSTAVMLYEKKEIDWVGHPFTNLPIDAIAKLESSDDFHSTPIRAVYWLNLNTERFPLNSAKIRKALSIALNRESLAKHVLLGETATKIVNPPPLALLKENSVYPDHHVKLAQQLFEEGMRELNLTRETFPTLTFNHSDIAGQKKLAEAIQQSWEKNLKIKVELQMAEWNVFFANLGQRQYQIGGCIFFSAFYDPIYFLEFFKEKANRYNNPQWENKHFQKLLQLADLETNQAIRFEHLKQAEEILLEEMPIIPLFIYNAKYLKSPALKELVVSQTGQVDFKWAYVEEKAAR